jgi:hypothetical protein
VKRRRVTDPRFPDAPLDSYVCEEGWLVVGDQAWTEDEWARTRDATYRYGRRPNGRPRKYIDHEDELRARRERYRARKAA